MPNIAHKVLTATDLHEPKGAASASANSVYVTDGAGSGDWTAISILAPQVSSFGTVSCRLSATSGVAITEADVATAPALYLIPTENNNIALYDGTNWQIRTYTQTTLSLDTSGHSANTCFSVFAYYDGSVVKIGTGPSWTNSTEGTSTTGTGSGTSEAELFEGRLVNKNAIILRNTGANSSSIPARQALLVGGFRTTSNGETADTAKKRLVSNVYNKYPRFLKHVPTATSWALATAGITTFRQAGANTDNQVEVFYVTGGNPVDLDLDVVSFSSTSYPTGTVHFGIGLDVATSNHTAHKFVMFYDNVGQPKAYHTNYSATPGQGYHKLIWVEATGNSSQAVYGDNTSLGAAQISALSGVTFN